MIAGMTLYEIFSYFLVYSLIGWAVEVAYHAVTQGKIVNRGFLAGPVCPVYGIGLVIVFGVIDLVCGVEAANIHEANAGVVFLAGMVLASAVEFIGGWGLYHAFHARWWDYRDKPFNLGGYICLEFSLYWGIGAILVVRVLHPVVYGLTVGLVPEKYGWPLMAVLYAGYLVDFIASVMIVMGLNRHLAELDSLRAAMRIVSDDLSERIGESTLDSMTRLDEGRVQAALARAELRDALEETRIETEKEFAKSRAEWERRRAEAERTAAEEKARRQKRWEEAEQAFKEEKARWEERRAEAEKRSAELRAAILRHRHVGTGRLLRAFPRLSFDNDAYDTVVKELREEMANPRTEPDEESSSNCEKRRS